MVGFPILVLAGALDARLGDWRYTYHLFKVYEAACKGIFKPIMAKHMYGTPYDFRVLNIFTDERIFVNP